MLQVDEQETLIDKLQREIGGLRSTIEFANKKIKNLDKELQALKRDFEGAELDLDTIYVHSFFRILAGVIHITVMGGRMPEVGFGMLDVYSWRDVQLGGNIKSKRMEGLEEEHGLTYPLLRKAKNEEMLLVRPRNIICHPDCLNQIGMHIEKRLYRFFM